jgi:NitT/TauT family transport system substrate-binding protein
VDTSKPGDNAFRPDQLLINVDRVEAQKMKVKAQSTSGILRFPRITLLVAAAALVLAAGCSSDGSAASAPTVEQQNLNVAVVPVVDTAGFFIALHDGLFRAKGLNVHFIPAASSETSIDELALSTPGSKSELDIMGGGYVSYLEAQHNWDTGQRPSVSSPGVLAANLYIFAEGALLAPGSGAIYTMPGSPIRTVADLKGKTVAINVPNNTLYLLVATVLAEYGLTPSDVHFVTRYSFPAMAGALKAGKIDAAVLPEPYASAAEELDGIVPIADLDQGATTQFATVGYAVTKTWAVAHPKTLAAFYSALEEGQQIADTDRAAVEEAMEDLPAKPVPLGVSKQTAGIMTVPYYPVGAELVGSVDGARLQSEVDIMEQFLRFPSFNIQSMLMAG